MKLAIVVIAYNRLDSLKRLLDSLRNSYYDNNLVDLIISIDKSDTSIIEQYAYSFSWNYGKKQVITHSENLGLRIHVLSIGALFDGYDALVVLEDDITVSPNFLRFARCCVNFYNIDERIAGISLYNFPINYHSRLPFHPAKSGYDVYFMNCAQSWGQVWMKHQWKAFYDWYKEHNEEFADRDDLPSSIVHWPKSSWLKYHTRYCIEQNKYFVYPYYSLSTNNGDAGTHNGKKNNLFQAEMMCFSQENYKLPLLDDKETAKYDGFFEPKFLASYLGLNEYDLCVDILGLKPSCIYKRYVLTSKSLPFKLLKSFALTLHPLELNIINAVYGNDVFLYDTFFQEESTNTSDKLLYFESYYRNAMNMAFQLIGIRIIILSYLRIKGGTLKHILGSLLQKI